MLDRIERAASLVLMLAAVVLTATVVHREWFASPPGLPVLGARRAHRIANWNDVIHSGFAVSTTRSPVTVVEFGDFECPYCRHFEQLFKGVAEQAPQKASLIFVYDPLFQIHRFALPAARAAECARAQGKFAEYHDVLFEKQDSLGLISWNILAKEAAISDTVAFQQCLSRTGTPPAIASGLALAQKLNIHATPTILINGWLVPTPQTDSALTTLIQAAGKGDRALADFLGASD